MSILISCLGCGVKLKAPDNKAGKLLKCPKCKVQILVPSLPSQVPEIEDSFADEPHPPSNNEEENSELVNDDMPVQNNNKSDPTVSFFEHIKKFFSFNSNADSDLDDELDDELDDDLDDVIGRPKNTYVGLSDMDIKIQKHRRRRIRTYFSPPIQPNAGCATIFIIIGVFGLVASIALFNFGGFLGGLAFLLLGIAMIPAFKKNYRKWVKKQVSDSEMDKYITDELVGLKKLSLQKSSLDVSELVGEQLLVTGFQFFNSASAEVLYKKGLDNILRYTPVNVTVLNLTANQIVCFQCVFDLTTGNPLNISTDEYFYKDVVSIATKTESGTYESKLFGGKVQLDSSEKFVLTTSGGTTLHVFLTDPKLIEKMGGGEMPTTEAEKTILVVRKMLREKKSNT